MGLKQSIKTALFGPPGPRPRKIHGGILRGFVFPIDTVCSTMQIFGLWEREIVGAVRRAAARADLACDIGANTGFYSLYFASRPNIKKVFALEPDEQYANLLPENLARNDPAYAAKVQFVPKFAGSRNNDPRFCRLDDLLRDEPGIPLFKIDVDGGELDVLQGAVETLKSRPCRLVIETHSLQLELDCAALLRDLGYEVNIIKNGWYRIVIPEGRTISHNRWLAAWKSNNQWAELNPQSKSSRPSPL